MKLKRLTLRNIRSYENETIRFTDGATLLYGDNGAGKTTVLQAVFAGLFQTNMTKEVGSEFTLDNLVRNTATDGAIELVFAVDGDEYTVNWEISVSEDDGERSAKTKSCSLHSPALPEPETGVRSVSSKVATLLNMDAESFVNSVYVQQGDISRLIHATNDQRKKILDGLLGLNRVDTLIDRMDKARREVKQKRKSLKDRHKEKRQDLNELPDEDVVADRIEDRKASLADVKSDISDKSDRLEQLRDRKKEVKSNLEKLSELEDDLEKVTQTLKDAQAKHDSHVETIQEHRQAKRDLNDQQQETEDELADAQDAIDEYDITDKETAESALNQAEQTVSDIETEKTNLTTEKEKLEDAELPHLLKEKENHKEEVESVQSEKQNLESNRDEATEESDQLEDAIEAKEDKLADLKSEIAEQAASLNMEESANLEELAETHIPEKRSLLKSLRDDARSTQARQETLHEQVDDLLETGECPLCGASEEETEHDFDGRKETLEQEITDAKERIETLDENMETLDELADNVLDARTLQTDTIPGLQDEKAEAQATIDSLTDDIQAKEDEIQQAKADLQETKDEIAEKQATIGSLESDIEELEDDLTDAEATVEAVEGVIGLYETLEDIEDQIENHEQEISHAQDLREAVQQTVDAKEQEKQELEAKLEEMDADELETKLEKANEYIETTKQEREAKKDERDELQRKLAEARQRQEDIQRTKQRVSELEEKVAWTDDRYSEAVEVIEAYEDVKTRLREQNIALLNKYANEVFNSLYQSETYRGMTIDSEYRIRLVKSDDTHIDPDLSSGGEQAIVNLALRAGIYRLIAKREGDGASLPPFILDEPTTFLDDTHVDELQTVIDTISEWNVPQVVVVSHDENLIENADAALHVEKDPSTETSHITATADGSGGEASAD